MNQYSNPTWWTKDNDTAWDRVKAAVKRDWDQTKHDMGGKQPDTKQNVNDTVKQASGNEAIPPRGAMVYEKAEPAYRFGYGARSHYGAKYPAWNSDLERELKNDWSKANGGNSSNWDLDSQYIHSGWDYEE